MRARTLGTARKPNARSVRCGPSNRSPTEGRRRRIPAPEGIESTSQWYQTPPTNPSARTGKSLRCATITFLLGRAAAWQQVG
eukprot:1176743-Prorocentrum_minimum.AAC.3